jgi:hypothetical protein
MCVIVPFKGVKNWGFLRDLSPLVTTNGTFRGINTQKMSYERVRKDLELIELEKGTGFR